MTRDKKITHAIGWALVAAEGYYLYADNIPMAVVAGALALTAALVAIGLEMRRWE